MAKKGKPSSGFKKVGTIPATADRRRLPPLVVMAKGRSGKRLFAEASALSRRAGGQTHT